ncbi:glycosyltransferase family 8 protein [bacterium]|nr:glycosyltransferase family 8 protein [bacterium]
MSKTTTAKSTINLAFAADEKYFQPMSVAMVSILKNSGKHDNLCFYIICNSVSDKLKNELLGIKKIKDCEIKFIDINQEKLSYFLKDTHCHITLTAYCRLFLPSLLPDLDKILYLDCDIIAKKNIRRLYNTDISKCYVGAVIDIGCVCWYRYLENCPYDFLNIMNTGVLLMNLKMWREDNLTQKAIELGKAGCGEAQHDQEIINILCHDKCLFLDMSWNVQDSFFRNAGEVKSNPFRYYIRRCAHYPKIIHYTTQFKPWNDIHIAHAFDWWYYNSFSPLRRKFPLNQILPVRKKQNV